MSLRPASLVAIALLAACGGDDASGAHGGHGGGGHGGPITGGDPARGEEIFRDHCAACHTLGRGDQRGPDLLDVHVRRPGGWLRRWLTDPAETAEATPYGARIVEEWGVLMPDPNLDDTGIADVVAFIEQQSGVGPMAPRPPVELSAEQRTATRDRYFDRCAGCHGTYRGGATGPDIGEGRSVELGTDTLAAVMRHGRPWGMPAFGREGLLSEAEIDRMASFLQLPPPEAPALGLDEARARWELVVPVAERPTSPEHDRDWQNFFGVVLRDPGQVAVFDGDTKEEVARIDVGFAVHILRSSSTGRYFYAVGRDGWVTLIDLWSSVPRAVARARGCFDARSVEASKYAGYEDRFLVEGCYWPPQYVVFDGLTLEPLARGDVTGTAVDTGEHLREVRVASVVASHDGPVWALALKESGHVALVDYAEDGFPIVTRIGAERFLHDGGLDRSGRYFLVAANARDRMAVVDLREHELVTTFETGALPHPGRGANWLDPTYGWVNATVHLGEGMLAVYGADPEESPEHAWEVVREVPLPSAGSLFLKTHPSSPWVFFDMALSTDAAQSRQFCVYSKERGEVDRCITPSDAGPAVHFELDRTGSEVWVSVWAEEGEIVVYDSATLEETARITGLETPTGKFNVFNTANDVY